MIPEYCLLESSMEHAFYLAGILRITPKQASATSLGSVTEQQRWSVIRSAWTHHSLHKKHNTHCLELLILVKGTKKYILVAPESDHEQLISDVGRVLETLEQQM